MLNEKKLAQEIIHTVGGRENINTAMHCMTRLRLSLFNRTKVKMEDLQKLNGILGVVEAAGQLQIILGPGTVNKVAAEIAILTGLSLGEVKDLKAQIADKNRTPVKLFLRKLANIFVPLIPAIVASGMVAGLTNIAIQLGADPKGTFAAFLNVIGWGIFSYLGIFVGINAAREFGGTPSMGGLAGVLIMNPAIATLKINQMALVPGRGGLIGVLLVAWFMSQLEKRLRKIVPNALDIIVVPGLTLFITGFITYYVLQPVGGVLSDGIVAVFTNLIGIGGAVVGFILAATFLPVVMTGLHQGLVPVHMEFLNTFKENPLLPILAMAGAGQVGATFAVYLKTKNNKLKEIIKGALPVGILGIGEPLIFGVTLPLGRPFVTACIGAGFGGAFQAVMHVSSVAIGVSGLPLAFLIKPGSVLSYLIGLLIAYIAGFITTWAVGFDDPPGEIQQQGCE
ncbi:phosphotransferase system eiib cysteine phosphorylation site [Lucifera butyrica]|uniref:Phosphotransferase system eiib cysteine phosphorylation site n=1 Tax=Lucifera butyrica TaxID=1351585 RepID=A0A498RDV5_9FIRM|nr:PTS transporter subunit EIIC [Lucifera butyrica]VBB09107.1 phosphotransferase system eiib cysteine phosphorylation site [Lucifera butyrica]